MGFARTRNRRRADAEWTAAELTDLARRQGGAVARVSLALGVALCLLTGAKLAHRWALTSPVFELERISFHGLTRATEADLLKLAGLATGQNLLRADVGALERAMVSHPWVKSVSIARHFPAGLSVRVEERVPAAMVALGDLYLLDASGDPFKKVQPQDVEDLPLVTGIGREAYVERPKESAARFARALAVAGDYQAARPERVRGRLSEIRLEGAEVTLVLAEGTEIRLGERDTAEALARLWRVRAELARRGLFAQVIHLDNRVRPGWVTVRVSAPVSERTGP